MRDNKNVLWCGVFRENPRDKLKEGAREDDGYSLNQYANCIPQSVVAKDALF